MVFQWFTLSASPLPSTDTQNLTNTWYLSILRRIDGTARNGHSTVSFQGNTVNIIRVTLEVKIHILHILLCHHIGKRTNTLLPPLCSLSLTHSLLLTQFLLSSVWGEGKKEKGNSTCPFPPAPTPPSPIRKTDLDGVCVWQDVMCCTTESLDGDIFIPSRR